MIETCQWPTLASPYKEALQTAVTYILAHFSVLGIIASGSIIRGNPGPTSDFDIFVIHAQPQRQRLQRLFHGVPAEIFVNPPHTIRGYFESEHKEGRPCTAHMLATGFPVLVNDPVVTTLCAEAQNWLQKAPLMSEPRSLWLRYEIVDLLDNARDILDTDPLGTTRILYQAVERMLCYAFLNRGRFLPRMKDFMATLQEVEPALAQLAGRYYQTVTVLEQLQIAEMLARQTIGVTEFFEWDSEIETV